MTAEQLATRQPSKIGDYWVWRCATKGAVINDIINARDDLLPWDVYWNLPGSLGPYVAEFHSYKHAMDALRTAVKLPAHREAACAG